jgi:8-oxo-dGTP pyrophosphatase MutT (NUDIX family)
VSVEAHDITHPNGKPGEHVLVVTPAASAVLALDGDDVFLVRQPRFGARSWVSEVIKGGADSGESNLTCAQRELREEAGLYARTWTSLGIAYEIPSIMSAPVALYLATDLERVPSEPEDVESIELDRRPFHDALNAAQRGGIDDAITIVALVRAAAHREGRR